MSFWAVVWVVLMLFWLFFGCATTWDPVKPRSVGLVLIPWLCVALLGAILFGAVDIGVPSARLH